MRKSGLHKQISSIFDGVPLPQNGTLAEDAHPSVEQMEPQTSNTTESDTPQETLPMPKASGSSLLQRMTADPSDAIDVTDPVPAPVLQVGRPMPVPKSKAMSKSAMGPGLTKQVKKAVFGSQSLLDPRQKKMAALVGILSLVFGVVLFVSLGGVGGPKAASAGDINDDAAIQSRIAKRTAQNWKSPDPLPQNFRNATIPAIKSTPVQQTGDSTADPAGLIVKGIVFSKNKPSAIINNEILSEGQNFNGIKIVKITKETVEFEANGKRWTQSVQR